MARFQERIAELFNQAKDRDYRITQEAFAAQFGATRNQIKGWLSGAGEPDSETMKIIARACNVSVDWLVGNTDIRDPIDLIAEQREPYDHDLPAETKKILTEFIEFQRRKNDKPST